MNAEYPAYGLWLIVILNVVLFLMFAFSFTRPHTARDWRSFGAFAAFIVALFTEMYGFPLTIYLLSGWLGNRYPGLDLLSHDTGHLWSTLLGWQGDPHVTPFHLLSYVFIGGGFILLSRAWNVLYKAQREHQLALTGPYAAMRHPQYVAFVLILLGFLLQWPTLLTLIMFPVLVVMYVRLARREERDAIAEFGQAYVYYTAITPAFFSHRNGQKLSQLGEVDKSSVQDNLIMSATCSVDPVEKTATAEELETPATAYLRISGMGCPQCATRVRTSLLGIYGISDAYIDHVAGIGKVVFAPKLTTVSAMVDAIAQAGNDGQHEYLAVPLGLSSSV